MLIKLKRPHTCLPGLSWWTFAASRVPQFSALVFLACFRVSWSRPVGRACWPHLCEQLSLCENWPRENKVPMRGPYAFYPGVALR